MKKIIYLSIYLFLYYSIGFIAGFAAEEVNISELNKLIEEEKYSESLEQITNYLTEYYSQNPQKVVIPKEFASENYIDKLDQLNKILHPERIGKAKKSHPESKFDELDRLNRPFEERKVSNFFLPENEQLAQTHKLAGMCNEGLRNYNTAINHFVQALRYSQPGKSTDYEIFYKIAQVYKKMDLFKAYCDFMESAINFNPDKTEYCLELGQALAVTSNIKEAVYYLEKYIDSAKDNVNPDIYSFTGRLCENIGKYLDAQKHYIQYLKEKPDDSEIMFALACLAFKKTGNFKLAFESFAKALSQLPEQDIYRRSKCFEYQGDMSIKELNYEDAISFYTQTISYQNQLQSRIGDDEKKSTELDDQIKALKLQIIAEQSLQSFENLKKLDELNDTKGKSDIDLRDLKFQYSRLAPGKVRWNLAGAYESTEQLEESIKYLRECIFYDYNAYESREKILKIQLKIKRGY